MTMLLPSTTIAIIFLYSMEQCNEAAVWSTQRFPDYKVVDPGGQSLQTHAKSQRFPGRIASREHL